MNEAPIARRPRSVCGCEPVWINVTLTADYALLMCGMAKPLTWTRHPLRDGSSLLVTERRGTGRRFCSCLADPHLLRRRLKGTGVAPLAVREKDPCLNPGVVWNACGGEAL